MAIVKTKYRYDTIYSEYDRGWYAEVYEAGTGREIEQTNLYDTRDKADAAARAAIAKAKQKATQS